MGGQREAVVSWPSARIALARERAPPGPSSTMFGPKLETSKRSRPNSDQTWRTIFRFRTELVQSRAKLAQSRPNFDEFGRIRTNSGRVLLKIRGFRSTLVRGRPHFARSRPSLGAAGRILVKSGRMLANCQPSLARNWSHYFRCRWDLGQISMGELRSTRNNLSVQEAGASAASSKSKT